MFCVLFLDTAAKGKFNNALLQNVIFCRSQDCIETTIIKVF